MPIRQVYGFVFDDLGRVVLQDDEGTFNLPGGTPEPSDADLAATLARECMEESQLLHGPPAFVGWQQVIEDDGVTYAQVRMAARLVRFMPRNADPCTGRTYRRLLTSVAMAPTRLGWGWNAQAQTEAATEVAAAVLGITFAAAPAEEYVA